jgi:hypothetical protein
MRDLATTIAERRIAAMRPEAIDLVRRLEGEASTLPQVRIETTHTFHAGLYARTVRIPAGSMITGTLIKIPTLLIFQGDALVYLGDGHVRLKGYHVLEASAGRKQVFVAHADTWLTMVFATTATTVEDAETEFTDEAHLLLSRRQP